VDFPELLMTDHLPSNKKLQVDFCSTLVGLPPHLKDCSFWGTSEAALSFGKTKKAYFWTFSQF